MKILKHPFGVFFREEENGGEGGASGGAAPEGDQTPNVFDSLPDEAKVKLQQNGIKDIDGLVKNWQDAQSYMGSSIRIPSEDAGDEDRQKFYEKLQKHAPNLIPRPDPEDKDGYNALMRSLGLPEKGDEYEVPELEDYKPSDEAVEKLRDMAHKAGLTKSQFKELASELFREEAQSISAAQEAAEADLAGLKKEWGSAFDERKNRAVKTLELSGAPDGLVQAAKDGQVGADVYQWLYSLSSNFKGEGVNAGNDQGSGNTMTPAEAEAQIQDIYGNRSHPFWNAGHPDHQKALKKMVELGKLADPQASTEQDLRSSHSLKS